MLLSQQFYRPTNLLFSLLLVAAILQGCHSSEAKNENAPPPVPSLPVLTIQNDSAVTFKEYTASLEGKINVEIRAQVDGYLNKIFIDEGSYVHTDQPLFKI